MTSDRDPPRLRTLKAELPSELSTALEETPEDYPMPAQLAGMAQQLRAVAKEPATRSGRPSVPVRRRPGRGPMAAVVLSFALGAAAGVLGSGGVFLLFRASSQDPRRGSPLVPSSPPRRAVLQPRASASSVEPALAIDGVSAAPARPARDTVRSPGPSEGADAPVASVSARAAEDRDELALLARAQSAMSSDPASALSLANDHEGRFARGNLAQEREVVAIDALLRLGRKREALGRAVRFHEQFPRSVHGRRIDVLLGKADLSSGDHN